MTGITEFILISVTLVVAIIGTLSNQSKTVKGVIIGLAVVTSIGTSYKTVSTARENEVNKKLIASLVQASNPPEYFSHDLAKQFATLLEPTNLYVSEQKVFKETGEMILTFRNSESSPDEIAGVLYISKRDMNPIYYIYAIDGDIKKELAKKIDRKWTNCDVHWNDCVIELSAISSLAFKIAPIEINRTTASMDAETLSFTLESNAIYRGKPVTVVHERQLIESLYGLNPLERGKRILEAGQMYILNNL